MGELPTAEVPVKTGTVLVVPLPVTVCAAALMENAAKQIAHPIICLCMILPFFCIWIQI
jgi:ABC-type polysaccharide transport system permease subunit